jgi:hypothetical protein
VIATVTLTGAKGSIIDVPMGHIFSYGGALWTKIDYHAAIPLIEHVEGTTLLGRRHVFFEEKRGWLEIDLVEIKFESISTQ